MDDRFQENSYIHSLHKMIFNGEVNSVVRRIGIIAIALVRKKLSDKMNQICNMDMLMHRIISVSFNCC